MKRAFSVVQAVALAVTAVAVAGCEEAPQQKVERVRAIKPYYVSEPAGGDVRRYSGTIIAANTSVLSFAVSGTVKTVDVNPGDRVKANQVLATLDPKSYELNVKEAQAEVQSQRAELKRVRQEIARKRELFKRGWIAKAAFEKTAAELDVAEGGLNLAGSRLGLAERDLAKTRLRAPFDGIISERTVDPFAEVSTGQKLFQIDSEGVLEVEMSISDSVIGRLSVGAPVSIDATTVPGCGCTGRITEIGVHASAANAVTVKAAILKSVGDLLPGMAVDVSVVLSGENGSRGFLVPLVAIAPGDDKARGYVFKFDQTKGVVRRTPVVGKGGADGNLIGISEGVEAGDILAAAGVSLLRDGQRVRLLGQ